MVQNSITADQCSPACYSFLNSGGVGQVFVGTELDGF